MINVNKQIGTIMIIMYAEPRKTDKKIEGKVENTDERKEHERGADFR